MGQNFRNRFPARRRFLKQSAALSAGAVGGPLLVLGRADATERAPADGAQTNKAAEPPREGAQQPQRAPTTAAAPAPARPVSVMRRPRRRITG